MLCGRRIVGYSFVVLCCLFLDFLGHVIVNGADVYFLLCFVCYEFFYGFLWAEVALDVTSAAFGAGGAA